MFHAQNDMLRASKTVLTTNNSERCTRITMTFPTKPASDLHSAETKLAVRSMLNASLSIEESDILYLGISVGLGDLFVEVTTSSFQKMCANQTLNLNALLEWDGYTRGLIVCCVESTDSPTEREDSAEQTTAPLSIDFCSRFFAPKAGIAEDPVTGSAHCALAPYFSSKLAKQSVVGRQISQRGGIVGCELADNLSSVKLTGTATTSMSGILWL